MYRSLFSSAILSIVMFHFASAATPAIEGYADYEAMTAAVKSLDSSEMISVESLGTTLGKREVWLITIGAGRAHEKPALLIMGNVEPAHLCGSEVAMRLARQIVVQAENDETARRLLKKYTLYIIPRPAPDASEAFFAKLHQEHAGNERSTDDDRDGADDEDPHQDLNGDGFFTQLRVADPAGKYIPHPNDARVLIEADPKKNERGQYSIYSEGLDDDGDEKFNEDGPGGVAFNRNFTFRYPYFQTGAGPHQVSEVETRAIADFAFSRPNIALVLTFSPEDNLMETWKPNASGDGDRIRTSLHSADAPYVNFVAEEYRKIHEGKDAPSPQRGEGSFVDWAYFHYGRWSFAARSWWIPKTAAKQHAASPPADESKKPAGETKEAASAGAADKPKPDAEPKKPSDEKRGADDINALRWFAAEHIDGFVDWTPIEHADFPGKKVDVGGFKPFFRLNPPAKELDGLAAKHLKFVNRLIELMPRVKIIETKVTALGGGVIRVSAKVINEGFLPTVSEMGKTTGDPQPLQLELKLSEGAKFVTGHAREQIRPLAGNGGNAEHAWLVLVGEKKKFQATLKVSSPSVGSDEVKVEWKE